MKVKLIVSLILLMLVFNIGAFSLEEGDVISLKVGEDIRDDYRYRNIYANFSYAGMLDDGAFSIAIRTGKVAYNLYYLVDNNKFTIRLRVGGARDIIVGELIQVTPRKIKFRILSTE